MTKIELLAVAGTLIAIFSSICAGASYFSGRGKETFIKGENNGGIKGDLKFIEIA